MTEANSFYRTPHLTTISFAVGVLLFFLPFTEIKCNGTTLAQLTGVNMITGSSPKMSSEFENMAKSFNATDSSGSTKSTKADKDGKVYLVAIIAVLLGMCGLVVSFTKKRVYNKLEMFLGIAGAVALLVLLVQVKADVNSQMKNESKEMDSLSGMMKVSVDFTTWFFLCVLSYLASAFFSYKQKDVALAHESPPANAPQLPIHNPGEQSEFPAAPSGERDLG